MKFEELSAKDQELLNTDLGEDLEKVAAEKVAAVNEVYAYGCAQGEAIAASIDEMYKQAAEEEEEKDEDEDEGEEKEASDSEFEKAASEYGAFIERGVFDTLTKLGSANYGDPMAYYYPYIEEKIAAKAAQGAVMKFMKAVGDKAKAVGGKAKDQTVKYHKGAVQDVKDAFTGAPKKHWETKGGKRKSMTTKLTTGERVKSGLKGTAKFLPHAGLVGGGTYLATRKKKES